MSSQLKPIKIYGDNKSPNPAKVQMVVKELDLPYEIVDIPFSDTKKPEYTSVNPNGRLPAIHDPNSGITLWESGAIIEYLVEQYDKNRVLSFEPGTPEYYQAKQWLYFQTSGQGPYYGQAVWFLKYHAENLESAKARYNKEINRVSGVLDGWLAKQKGGKVAPEGLWLVGSKLSYADIAFVPYQSGIEGIIGKENYNEDDYPRVKEWMGQLKGREKIRDVLMSK
ncbi:MAG: hypothetical protein Q9214_000625 [Letrouitia sp. 1 TL-2023]